MARTGEKENKEANKELQAQQAESYRKANEMTDKYNAYVGELEARGDPFSAPEYRQNQNLLAATGAGAANAAGEEAIANAIGRTGTNTASEPYYRRMLAKDRARAQAEVLTSQRAQDIINSTNWRQWLATAKLGAAPVSENLYGTATSGRSSALGNLTELGKASYGPIGSLIGAAGTVASGALGGYMGGIKKPCYVAAVLYGGWDEPRTSLVRFWLTNRWARESVFGACVVGFYRAIGERMATVVKRSNLLRRALRPLFDAALNRAVASALVRR